MTHKIRTQRPQEIVLRRHDREDNLVTRLLDGKLTLKAYLNTIEIMPQDVLLWYNALTAMLEESGLLAPLENA